MLTDTCAHDHILLSVGGQFVQLLDHLLRLHTLTRDAWLISEGVCLLPFPDVRKPRLTRGRFDEGNKGCKVVDDISNHGDGGLYNLIDILGLNLEMNDAALALCSGRTSSRSEG